MSLVWNTAIFKEDGQINPFLTPPTHIQKLFSNRRIRNTRLHRHTLADPFLYVKDDTLYLFAEIQRIGQSGYINCWASANGIEWKDMGVVLSDKHHYSYPYVFENAGATYLLPETSSQSVVMLYRFSSFPNKVEPVKIIMEGSFVDSNIQYIDGLFYLITTNEHSELMLFYAEDLYGSWTAHPSSPLRTDKITSRCGGGLQEYDGMWYRVAQNTTTYGAGITIFAIEEISRYSYSERIINDNFRSTDAGAWDENGRHHLSYALYKGNTYMAMDGLQKDFLMNKLINQLYKIL